MGYKDKTYVIFDGDNDIWAYAYMKGWNKNENVDFNFEDAHDLNPLTSRAEDEDYIKGKLLERFKSANQVIVLIGEHTKNLYRFVRWEIEVAQKLDLPIIAVNLNGLRKIDDDLCPAILKNRNAVHVSFKMKIIKYALDNFPPYYHKIKNEKSTDWYYSDEVYKDLGIE
jgi:hypothetical protein